MKTGPIISMKKHRKSSSNRVDEETDSRSTMRWSTWRRGRNPLQDYLNDQLAFLDLPPEDLELIRYLISHIDDRGYLATPLDEIARGMDGAILLADLERALVRIHNLDPPGVGARDYRECLLLQVTPETPHREVVRALITNHLEDIQHNRLPVIQKRNGFDLETIKEAIEVLKHLNPKPGSKFVSENIPYVVPDIAVERTEAGEYEIKLLDDWTPNIYISRRYIDLYRDKAADPKAKEFLKRKIQSAQWLIEAAIELPPQHVDQGDQGHHPAPAGVSRQGSRTHRAAQDAADRRHRGRPRHHGQPGRR